MPRSASARRLKRPRRGSLQSATVTIPSLRRACFKPNGEMIMMKKLIIAAALCCASTTPALAATKADAMKWEVGYQVLSAVDAAQTIYCLRHDPDCEEANPLFGKHPKT